MMKTELTRNLASNLAEYLVSTSEREHHLSVKAMEEFTDDIERLLIDRNLPRIPSGEMWAYLANRAATPSYRNMCVSETTHWTIQELSGEGREQYEMTRPEEE